MTLESTTTAPWARKKTWNGILAALFFMCMPHGICNSQEDEESAPHPMNIVQDEAKFIYYQNGHALGTSESRWDGDGNFENRSELRIGGQKQKGMLVIHAGAGGRWTSITMMTVKGVAEMERTGTTVKMSVGGKMHTIDLKPGTFLMEDMSPALMSQAISAYDHEKAGEQKIPLYFLPIVSTEGSLKFLEAFDY